MVTLATLCLIALMMYSLYNLGKSKEMRELKEWDRNTKKFVMKNHESFDLREDQLVLVSKKDGEQKHQNIFLFDEKEGVSFCVGNEYKVEIKMTRLDEQPNLKNKCLEAME